MPSTKSTKTRQERIEKTKTIINFKVDLKCKTEIWVIWQSNPKKQVEIFQCVQMHKSKLGFPKGTDAA